jgi:iduronate 2-sulfatase
MNKFRILARSLLVIVLSLGAAPLVARDANAPNVVIILTDDQGFADLSFNPLHPAEVDTPHMDALAGEGVFFSQAYISGSVCSPTRAGLMLGRYQQRVGVYTAGDGGRGFDPKTRIFPGFLPASYRSTVIGKWHMGLDNDYPRLSYHAMNRGFSECFKFMGRGGHDYFASGGVKSAEEAPVYRNKTRTQHEGYLTDTLSQEAVEFIDRNKKRPFLLYLAYNAVHAPKQAPAETIAKYAERFPKLSRDRQILMAMLEHLDRGIGTVVGKLKKEGIFDDTLLFFLTDNGGSKAMSADNTPLHGFKGSLYEGGIRTPFVVSWPRRFGGGRRIDAPVISLDILPTVLDAIGATSDPSGGEASKFDGRSLLPLLEERTTKHHERLFWSEGGLTGEWAVREGKWKLRADKKRRELFDLSQDVGETKDLAREKPGVVKRLEALYASWLEPMADPIGGSGKHWTGEGSKKKKAKGKEKNRQRREERKKRRDAEKKKKKRTPPDDAPGRSEDRRGGPAKSGETPVGIPDANPDETAEKTAKRPNVLWVICDDLNRHVSTSGYPHIRTPALDALAAESLTFTRSYCQYPVCGPSRASFLSGLYPESTRVLDNKLGLSQRRPKAISLPQHFRQRGYWTAATGKIFHRPEHAPEGTWDASAFFQNDELPVVAKARRKFESAHGSVEDRKNRRLWKQARRKAGNKLTAQTPPGHGRSGLRDEQHRDGKNVRQAIQWIESPARGERPFFICVGIHKPHVPFLAPDKYFDLYPRSEIRYEPNPLDDWKDIPRLALVKRSVAFGFELGKENDALRREYMQAYHACISFVDAQLGLLFDTMRKREDWKDTIVIFTSDHGYHLGEHYLWGKVTLFEECARVPLLVRVPGKTPAGASTSALVEHVDIYPTLVELCGLTAPDSPLQGRSFANILARPETPGREDVYTVVTRGQKLGRSIRTQRWRYAEWGSSEQAELYDLEKDPRELSNQIDEEKRAAVVKEMRQRLARRRQEASALPAATRTR